MNELRKYRAEQEQQTAIYNELLNKLEECKDFNNGKTFEKNINSTLFGRENINDLKADYKLPPNHVLNLYINASKPDKLKIIYERSNKYYAYLISECKSQLEFLQKVTNNPNDAKRYEKRNFMFYNLPKIEAVREEHEKHMQETGNQQRKRQKFILKALTDKLTKPTAGFTIEAELIKRIEKYIEEKNYDKYNLTQSEQVELNQFKDNELYLMKLKNDELLKVSDNISRKYFSKQYDSDKTSDFTEFEFLNEEEKDFVRNNDLTAMFDKKDLDKAIELSEKRKEELTQESNELARLKAVEKHNARKFYIKKKKRVLKGGEKFVDDLEDTYGAYPFQTNTSK